MYNALFPWPTTVVFQWDLINTTYPEAPWGLDLPRPEYHNNKKEWSTSKRSLLASSLDVPTILKVSSLFKGRQDIAWTSQVRMDVCPYFLRQYFPSKQEAWSSGKTRERVLSSLWHVSLRLLASFFLMSGEDFRRKSAKSGFSLQNEINESWAYLKLDQATPWIEWRVIFSRTIIHHPQSNQGLIIAFNSMLIFEPVYMLCTCVKVAALAENAPWSEMYTHKKAAVFVSAEGSSALLRERDAKSFSPRRTRVCIFRACTQEPLLWKLVCLLPTLRLY